MRSAALLTFFVSLLAAAQDVSKDKTNEDAATLKGRWEIVSSEFEGKPASAAYRAGTVIVFEGDKLYFTDGFAKSAPATFKLDEKAKPRSIDIGEDKSDRKAGKGIYSLDGDSLKLCLNLVGVRPKEFKTVAGDKTNLFVLKRQKP
ncbi:MAG: TIGR03067 domain-containing protein [Planctomycetaceae bacterium]|nr:TIGR03067 domain-containing protein [Planctomycetaceae bacterium]